MKNNDCNDVRSFYLMLFIGHIIGFICFFGETIFFLRLILDSYIYDIHAYTNVCYIRKSPMRFLHLHIFIKYCSFLLMQITNFKLKVKIKILFKKKRLKSINEIYREKFSHLLNDTCTFYYF